MIATRHAVLMTSTRASASSAGDANRRQHRAEHVDAVDRPRVDAENVAARAYVVDRDGHVEVVIRPERAAEVERERAARRAEAMDGLGALRRRLEQRSVEK